MKFLLLGLLGLHVVSESDAHVIDTPLSCAASHDGSCPLPSWDPVWDMNMSTIVQGCNYSGYLHGGGQYGIITFDWQTNSGTWNVSGNASEMLVEQARITKSENPHTRVMVYRNFALAQGILSTHRAIMYDQQYADFFLQYQPNNPGHIPIGTIFNSPTSLLHGEQYFWNWSNPAVLDWWLEEVIGSQATGSEYIDGIFTDDVDGTFQEHETASEAMGMSTSQIADYTAHSQHAYQAVLKQLINNQAYNWQAFGSEDWTNSSLPVAPGGTQCITQMRYLCTSESWQQPKLLSAPGANVGGAVVPLGSDLQSVASFLIARGPYWWYGYGWSGQVCDTSPILPYQPQHPALWNLSPGKPLDNCTETDEGVFRRKFEKGSATLDCNQWTAELDFQSSN